jgi:hypothetical protein
MTRKQAEKITGLSIRAVPAPPCEFAFIGVNGDGVALVAGRDRSPGDALKKLVENNYAELRYRLDVKQKHKCGECGKFGTLQFHHLQHRSKGRIDSEENVVGLCQTCHGIAHGTRL